MHMIKTTGRRARVVTSKRMRPTRANVYASVLLDNSRQSQFIKETLFKIEQTKNIQPKVFIGATLDYVSKNPQKFNLTEVLENSPVNTPKLKNSTVLQVRLNRDTKDTVSGWAKISSASRTQVYNQVLEAVLNKVIRNEDILQNIVVTVDPNDPWPNSKRNF